MRSVFYFRFGRVLLAWVLLGSPGLAHPPLEEAEGNSLACGWDFPELKQAEGQALPAPPVPFGQWRTYSPMPTPRSEMACALLEAKIYVAGGITKRGTTDQFEVYDIEKDRWEELAPLPVGLNHLGMAALQGKIYVSGGYTDMMMKKPQQSLFVYDPMMGVWEQLADMPTTRAAHFMIAMEEQLYLFGGEIETPVWSYAPVENKWQENTLSKFPIQRNHIQVVLAEGNILIIGGRNEEGPVKACWKYKWEGQQWGAFTSMPYPIGGHVATYLKGRVHYTGGEDADKKKTVSIHYIYDLKTGKWVAGSPMPTARHGAVSVLYKDRWYVIGGAKKAFARTPMTACGEVEVYEE